MKVKSYRYSREESSPFSRSVCDKVGMTQRRCWTGEPGVWCELTFGMTRFGKSRL
jgi:hypothetical protein